MIPEEPFWSIGNEEDVFAESLRRLEARERESVQGQTPSGDISATLAERGKRYGEFPGHARITQDIKRAMIGSGRWHLLSNSQREALEMIAHKIGRILNGDPNYHDSWHDIVGYAKLVADELELSDG